MRRVRSRNTSRTAGFTRRSTYRWRYRVSTSRRPCHFSGSGRTDFERNVHALTWMVSSPVRVRMRSPVTPTKSATSRSVKPRVGVSENVGPRVELDRAGLVEDVGEAGLAVVPDRHDAPGHADRPGAPELLLRGRVPPRVQRPRPVRHREAGAERVDAGGAEGLELLVTPADELVPGNGRPALHRTRRLVGHRPSYRRPANRIASMNGSMSPSITASTLPISTFVRWSLMSW